MHAAAAPLISVRLVLIFHRLLGSFLLRKGLPPWGQEFSQRSRPEQRNSFQKRTARQFPIAIHSYLLTLADVARILTGAALPASRCGPCPALRRCLRHRRVRGCHAP